MSAILQEIKEKINLWVKDPSFFTAMLLLLVAVASFGLGRQSVVSKYDEKQANTSSEPINDQTDESFNTRASDTKAEVREGTYYVASKNGSVYHLPYCSGAKRIREDNKVIFKTKEEAEAAGLRPAANCPGLQP